MSTLKSNILNCPPFDSTAMAAASRAFKEGNNQLLVAAMQGECGKICELISTGVDPNLCDSLGLTPISMAARTNQAKAIETLISQGADINFPDHNGKTPIIRATFNDSRDALLVLLKSGGNPLARDASQGNTALHYAAIYGYEESATLLCEWGGFSSMKSLDGLTPLETSLRYGYKKICRELSSLSSTIILEYSLAECSKWKNGTRGDIKDDLLIIKEIIENRNLADDLCAQPLCLNSQRQITIKSL